MKDIVFGLIYLILLGYFLLAYPFAFNFELYMHGHYFGVVIAGIAILAYGLFSFFGDQPGTPALFLLLVLTAAYLGFPSIRGNEYLMNASIAALCLVLLRSMSLDALRILLMIVAAGGLAELTIALTDPQTNLSAEPTGITGTLHNSGVLAVFLTIQLPLLWYAIAWCCRKSRHSRWLPYLLFCLPFLTVLAICIYNKARIAIVTAAVLAVLVLWRRFKKDLLRLSAYARTALAALFLCASAVAGYYFYHLKQGSSIGRLLILDVSVRHLADHFWLGTGLGRFSWYYPQWQAAYFLAHPQPEGPFFLSAGETYVAFNEFLQLLETIGLLGFFLVLLSLAWLFRSVSTRNRELLLTCKATVIAILCCCSFHYPLHQNAVLLILALCFSIAAAIRENRPVFNVSPAVLRKYGRQFNLPAAALRGNRLLFNIPAAAIPRKWLALSIAALAVPVLLTACDQYASIEKWQSIRDDDKTPRDTLKKEAAGCYDQLHYDGKFLAEYGAFLAQDPVDLPGAIAMAEASQKTFISWTSTENLAYYYLQQKDYGSAIRTFEWLSAYVPHRYRPRLELLELYKRTHRPDRAILTAGFILAMPVKVASDEVSAIKKEADSALKSSQ